MKAILRQSSHLRPSNFPTITSARYIHHQTLRTPSFNIPSYIHHHHLSFSSSAEAEVAYTLEQLKELRSISGAPLKECKKALANTSDTTDRITEALDWLRIRGKSIAQQKSSDVAKYGFISMYKDTNTASLCEVNCVTDFVENNPIFQDAVMNISHSILKNDTDISPNCPLNVDEVSNLPVIEFKTGDTIKQTIGESLTDIVSSIRENLVLRRAYKIHCSPSGVICGYLHGRKNDNLGMKGSLVSLETDLAELSESDSESLKELGQNVATHIVANYPQPKYIRREEMTEEKIEKEKELILKTIMEKGGDAQNMEIVQKQIEGKMKKYFMENVLMEQPFCLEDDNKLTIEKLVNKTAKELKCNITIANMVVYNLGES